MTCRLALALAFAACGAFLSAAPGPAAPVFSSDSSESDLGTGDTVFRGSCRYRDGAVLVSADEIRFNSRTNLLVATGHAVLTWGEERLLADFLELDRARGAFRARNLRVGRYPFYVQGDTAEGTRTEVTIHHASISYTDPGRWKPSVRAETIIYSPGHYIRTVRSLVGLQGQEFLPLGALKQDLGTALGLAYMSLSVGYRSSLGGLADLGLRLPVFPGFKAGGDLGLFTRRGLMAGPSADYFDPSGDGSLLGRLRSGWIDDNGLRYTDVLGRTVPRQREYAEWSHRQQVGERLTLDGELNWWSDSDVVRDFDPKRFYPLQSPDNFLQAEYAGDNYFASAFARFRPNTWQAVQERLPEFDFNLLPTALGGGFYQRLSAGAAYLREDPPFGSAVVRGVPTGSGVQIRSVPATGGPTLAGTRLDTFYEVSRPWAPNNWFAFTPVAGTRLTDYSDTVGAAQPGGYLRVLGEVGFDALLRSSGTFNCQDPVWEIDGLRHLLTPVLSYRYIPDADKGRSKIPTIDRPTFNTYLPPLDLGDIRYLDRLRTTNTLRLGLDNTLQTRDQGYGSRDLVVFNSSADLKFHRYPDDRDFSDLHFDLAVTPTRWLEYDVTEVLSPTTFQLRQFTSGLVIHDGDAWSFQIGNDFVRHENDNYILNYTLRLNEQFSANILALYDARLHLINRVAAGLTQNLANTWKLDYLLVFNGGPNREGRVGFEVQVDILRF